MGSFISGNLKLYVHIAIMDQCIINSNIYNNNKYIFFKQY